MNCTFNTAVTGRHPWNSVKHSSSHIPCFVIMTYMQTGVCMKTTGCRTSHIASHV